MVTLIMESSLSDLRSSHATTYKPTSPSTTILSLTLPTSLGFSLSRTLQSECAPAPLIAPLEAAAHSTNSETAHEGWRSGATRPLISTQGRNLPRLLLRDSGTGTSSTISLQCLAGGTLSIITIATDMGGVWTVALIATGARTTDKDIPTSPALQV